MNSTGMIQQAVPAPSFPLRASANQRYLVDQNAVPFPILGRTAWFVTSLSSSDEQTFLDDSLSRGHNAIEFHVINHDPRGNHPPFDGAGNAPFLKRLDGGAWNGSLRYSNIHSEAPDLTTPNAAYWNTIDAFISSCAQQGVLALMFPAYVGYAGGSQGWMQELVANGPSRVESYGAWIANRYKTAGNIVWMMGGDMASYDSSQGPVEQALRTGIDSVSGQLATFFSAEWDSEMIGTDQQTFGPIHLNSVYSFSGNVTGHGRRAYAYSPVEPAFLLEEPYDQEGSDGRGFNGSATQPVRRFQWWGVLCTIGGYVSGNGYVWPFVAPDWQNHLDTQGSRDMARLNAFIRSIEWYSLVPSGLGGMKTLVTAGGSSPGSADYVSAAAKPDGKLLVLYVPPAHSGNVTVDMTALSAASRARWFNPASGAYTDITGGRYSLANTGTYSFTPPGDNGTGHTDWVLVLDAAGAASAPPTVVTA